MKITGWRTLKTVHRWGRPIGDVNGTVESGVTEVPLLILETDEGVSGVGLGGHADIARIFPAIEGEDPRAVTALYDRMQSWVFKSGHAGSVFGAIGVVDMALWDLKANWRTNRCGGYLARVSPLFQVMPPGWISLYHWKNLSICTAVLLNVVSVPLSLKVALMLNKILSAYGRCGKCICATLHLPQ